MFAGFAAVFISGALAVKTTGWTISDVIPMVVAGLLAVEHFYNGNTSSATQA